MLAYGTYRCKNAGLSVLLLAEDVLRVLLDLMVVAVVDEVALLLAVMIVGRTGKLLVEAVVLAVVRVEAVAAVVRVITAAVVVGAGTGTGPGRSSAGAARVGVANGAGSAACRFHHNGRLISCFS